MQVPTVCIHKGTQKTRGTLEQYSTVYLTTTGTSPLCLSAPAGKQEVVAISFLDHSISASRPLSLSVSSSPEVIQMRRKRKEEGGRLCLCAPSTLPASCMYGMVRGRAAVQCLMAKERRGQKRSLEADRHKLRLGGRRAIYLCTYFANVFKE